ncbi:MAG: nuclear transport factor 2 family protein [Hyphomonadaceae bacterium]|nr:nuclear transport factor 2 family protein [Hyphomonadaceae bacterium]
MSRLGAVVAAAILVCTPAFAQNLSLRAPPWAQALLSADVTPTTGGRALIAAEGIPLSVRVTIAPGRGGIARVIRYDLRGEVGQLAVRRFTGHPSTGWWLWGGDAPRLTEATPTQRTEIANLVRAAASISGQLAAANEPCPTGEQAYVELALDGRASSISRACVTNGDAAGRLVLRLSEIAGSRTEEELAAAAVAELLETDRAFNAMAQSEGVPAAFARYAAEDGLIVTSTQILNGRAGISAYYQNWPPGAQLQWAPETGRVSARGDMGWTWGNAVYIAPDGARTPTRYVTVWKRDYDGQWRFAFDAAID